MEPTGNLPVPDKSHLPQNNFSLEKSLAFPHPERIREEISIQEACHKTSLWGPQSTAIRGNSIRKTHRNKSKPRIPIHVISETFPHWGYKALRTNVSLEKDTGKKNRITESNVPTPMSLFIFNGFPHGIALGHRGQLSQAPRSRKKPFDSRELGTWSPPWDHQTWNPMESN